MANTTKSDKEEFVDTEPIPTLEGDEEELEGKAIKIKQIFNKASIIINTKVGNNSYKLKMKSDKWNQHIYFINIIKSPKKRINNLIRSL